MGGIFTPWTKFDWGGTDGGGLNSGGGGDFLAMPLDPEGHPPAGVTLLWVLIVDILSAKNCP